jgi:hypothetical protein
MKTPSLQPHSLKPSPFIRDHWALPLRPACSAKRSEIAHHKLHLPESDNLQSDNLESEAPLRRVAHRAILSRVRNMEVRPNDLMAGLAAVWFVLFQSLAAQASTINGNIRNTSGNPYATNALFTPLSTPQADGTTIIVTTPTNVIAATDGSFSVTLKQGNYKVTIGNVPRDSFIISVPNDAATYSLTTLISSQLTYSYPTSPVYEEKLNKGVANGYASLNNSSLVPLAQLGAGAANGYVLGTDGSTPSWQPPPLPYLFDANQFALGSSTNVALKKAAAITNAVIFSSGLGPALSFAAGAGLTLTNGSIDVRSNGIVNIGDNSGLASAQLRFQVGSFATDYTGSEAWNFRTAAGGGRDASTVARIVDLTNGLAIATQDGSGTNVTAYATVSTNLPLSIVGTANHATNHLEIRSSSGVILGYVATNGIYRSQYDFIAQLTTTDNTTNTVYSFTPANNSVARVFVNISGWNSTSSASYAKAATFKTVSGTVSLIGTPATIGSAEDDTAFESIVDTVSNTIRVRVAGNTGRTVNWTVYGTTYYAP